MATNISSAEPFQTNSDNAENYALMWVDESVNSKENLGARNTLAKIHNQFDVFESIDTCENAIRQLSDTTRVILIITGSFGKQLLPRIHHLQQVSVIYIFCVAKENYLEWAKEFNKVKYISRLTVKFDCLFSF